jgi:hypothetical protein
MTRVTTYLRKQRQWTILVPCLILTAIIGFLDFITGYELDLSLFYLVPLCLVTWYTGKNFGIIIALVSAVVWLCADIQAGHSYSHPAVSLWNGAIIFGFFLMTVIILSKLKAAHERQATLVSELREALDNVRVLKGLIPICAWCKKIRDDEGYWKNVETYFSEHSDASFTHGMCPQCKAKMQEEIRSKKMVKKPPLGAESVTRD